MAGFTKKGRRLTGSRGSGWRNSAFATDWVEDAARTVSRRKRGRSATRSGARSRVRSASSVRMRSQSAARVRSGMKRKTTGAIDRAYDYKRTRLTKIPVKPRLLVPYALTRFQGIKQEVPDEDPTTSTGQTYLGYYPIRKGDVTAAEFETPIHMLELTMFNNIVTTVYGAHKKLLFGNDGGIIWQTLPNQLPNGINNSAGDWQNENLLHWGNSTTKTYSTKLQHAWYDIRVKLYGCRKQPITYDVMLVRFDREYLIPDYTGASTNTPVDPGYAARYKAFWQALVKNQIVNTILPGTSKALSGMRVLRRKRVVLQAGRTDELDRNPSTVDLHWFVRDNRILNYLESNNPFVTDTAVDSVQWSERLQATTTNSPTPRSRMFLLIRCTDMTSLTNDEDQDDSPSYDLVVRRKTYGYATGQ